MDAAIAPPTPRRRVDVVAELEGVTLRQVREAISPACYKRSARRALAFLAFDAALYLTTMAGVFLAPAPAAVAFGVLAGCAVAFLFIWGHDAAHGALFASRRWSEVPRTATASIKPLPAGA